MSGPQIIGFLGAKGGVGISSIAANLAIVLARAGSRVALVDGAPFGRGLYCYLGFKEMPESSLLDWQDKRYMPLAAFAAETIDPGVTLLSGLRDLSAETNAEYSSKPDIMNFLRNMNESFVIMDLGNSPDDVSLDYWLHCDISVIVTTAEPASIANSNLLIKRTFERILFTHARRHHIDNLIADAKNRAERERNPHAVSWLYYLKERDPIKGEDMIHKIDSCRIHLVLNKARTPHDETAAEDLAFLWRRYFGMRFEFLTGINEDGSFHAAAQRGEPVVLKMPDSKAADSIEDLAQRFRFHTRQEKPMRSRLASDSMYIEEDKIQNSAEKAENADEPQSDGIEIEDEDGGRYE